MKTVVSFLASTVLATGAFGQGVVTFASTVLNPTPYIYFADGVTRFTGTQYAVQLYYSTTTPESLAAHTAAPNRFRLPGSSAAGTWSTAGGATRTLTGGGVGVPVWMQLRVWDLDQFPIYEAAVDGGGITATSAIFQYTQRLSRFPSPTDTYMTDAAGNPLFASFIIPVVPEPSVALLVIPAMALLAWQYRRRRFISSRN